MKLYVTVYATLLCTMLLCSSCGQAVLPQTESTADVSSAACAPTEPLFYRLESTVFLEKEVELCSLAEEYLTLDDEDFTQRYPPQRLWDLGVFDRLLFDERFKEPVVAGISVGDSMEDALRILGEPQFRPTAEDNQPLLYGYKTPTFYFVLQEEPDDGKIQTICLRRRYVLPKENTDILPFLVNLGQWYGGDHTQEFERYFDENIPVEYTQWSRGSMTLICDYGFYSTSGNEKDSYGIYADFEGVIPRLPSYASGYSGEEIQRLYIHDKDYPQQLIYNIYYYRQEIHEAMSNDYGEFSPDGNIYAWPAEDNPLDMRSSGMYESAHVRLHWMDGSRPDTHIYFGHFSTVLGFLNNRYLAEYNQNGLHIYDLQREEIVYSQDSLAYIGPELHIDRTYQQILDQNNELCFTYSFNKTGEISVLEDESLQQ